MVRMTKEQWTLVDDPTEVEITLAAPSKDPQLREEPSRQTHNNLLFSEN